MPRKPLVNFTGSGDESPLSLEVQHGLKPGKPTGNTDLASSSRNFKCQHKRILIRLKLHR